MRFTLPMFILAGAIVLPHAAGAVEPRIGLAAPAQEATAVLGRQMRQGADFAARNAGAELVAVDEECTAEGGEIAARTFRDAGVDAVVGFLCTQSLEAALPILADAGIPVIASAVRSNGITDRRQRNGWLVWRVAPRADAELAAVADILVSRWRQQLFAIVDDGTIHGRELAESLRLAAEIAGLKPVFVDTYRPQSENQIGLVGRLRRAGASHVFVGGDRDDIAIMARDAAGLDYDLTIAGPESLRAAGEVPLAAGTLMIAVPEWADGAGEAALRRFREAGIVPEGYVAPTYAATEIAIAASRLAAERGTTVADVLTATTFDTLLGAIAFDGNGDLASSPFRLLRYDGQRFLPIE